MSCRVIEIQKQTLEIGDRFSPYECIYKAPEDKRNKNPDGPALEKFPGTIVQRELKITGGHNEKRHTCPYKRVEE
jgi:hypothetical protein